MSPRTLTLTRLVSALLLPPAGGCSEPARGPFYDDHKLLRFGVDPGAEAVEVRRNFEAAGHRLTRRIAGRHFTALAFEGPEGRPSGVRVVTARGIALALDSESATAVTEGVWYALPAPPVAGTEDADGDGFDEIFIARGRAGRTCILAYRVRDSGFVDLVEPDLATFSGDPSDAQASAEDTCVEQVHDQDGRIELQATWTITGLPLAIQPSVPVVLVPRHHDYVPSGSPERYADALAGAKLELAEAQAAADAQRVYEIAVRISALLLLSGYDREAQLAWMTAAFAGLPADSRDPAVEAALKARVRTGLRR